MRNISQEISPPNTPEGFEHLCADIYAEVFRVSLPSGNGRRGQSQHGVDIFFDQIGGMRIAVQCKRYVCTDISQETLVAELAALDKGGALVDLFVLATTALSDERIVRLAQSLTDARAKDGKCKVHVDFWGDICRHIFNHPPLRRDYAPNSPDGLFEEIRESHASTLIRTTRIEEILAELLESTRKRLSQPEEPQREIRDAHGRYLVDATRTYVRTQPLMKIGKIRPIAIAASVTGFALFFCAAFAAPIFKLPLPVGFAFVGLLVALVGVLFMMTCNQLRRRGITYALPLHRELLLEADHLGNAFVTRIAAPCPFCSRDMRYRFLGDWRRELYLRMVCDRNPSHSLDFDYTTLEEPGTDFR